MAVEQAKVKERLRALFPKANLTPQRLDEISAKLAAKPEDDADDDAIDKVINDFNENSFVSIEDIAKNDDRVRTLTKKATELTKGGTGSKTTPSKEDDKGNEDPLSVILDKMTGLETELASIKAGQTKQSISDKFKADERLKNVPEFMLKRYTPENEDGYEAAVEELVNDWKPFVEKNKLSAFGTDAPPAGQGKDDKKEVSEKDADALAEKLLA